MILRGDPKHDPLIFRIVTFSLVFPMSMPAALRRPQEKHTPGILEHVPYVFCRFVLCLAWCSQSACLRRFGEKTRPLEFWSMIPCVFCRLLCFLFDVWQFLISKSLNRQATKRKKWIEKNACADHCKPNQIRQPLIRVEWGRECSGM